MVENENEKVTQVTPVTTILNAALALILNGMFTLRNLML